MVLIQISFCKQIKIWEDLKAVPLVVLRPHDGQSVYSATFLTATDRPDHIILVTAVHVANIFIFVCQSLVMLVLAMC